jgi:hypothetical protein
LEKEEITMMISENEKFDDYSNSQYHYIYEEHFNIESPMKSIYLNKNSNYIKEQY